MSSLYGTQEDCVVDETKIWFYPNIPECHATSSVKAYLGGRSVLLNISSE